MQTPLLAQMKRRLQKLQRASARIIPMPDSEDNFHKSQLISHFHGIPYFERGEQWPVNRSTKRPLDFVLQIVNDGQLPLPREVKIVQFFYDWHNPAFSWKHSGWRIKIYNQIQENKLEKPESKYSKKFCSIRFEARVSLPDWDSIDHYAMGFAENCLTIDPARPWEVYAQLRQELVGNNEIDSFVGGYPQWIQGFATPRIDGQLLWLLVQIDSHEQAYLQWGDTGSVYLFFHPQHPHESMFVLQTM